MLISQIASLRTRETNTNDSNATTFDYESLYAGVRRRNAARVELVGPDDGKSALDGPAD